MKLPQSIRNIVFTGFLVAAPLCADSIVLSYPAGSEDVTAQIGYTFRTVGNGNINNGQTQFNPITGDVTVSETIDYDVSALAGSTISAATLDFAGAFAESSLNVQLLTGTGFFYPVFSRSTGAASVTISSGVTTTTVNALSGSSYDLLPLFQGALATGSTLHVTYNLVDHFTADNSLYGGGVDSEKETFLLTDTFSFTTSGGNGFFASFTPAEGPAPAPEPGSLMLAGLGLVTVAAVRLRKR